MKKSKKISIMAILCLVWMILPSFPVASRSNSLLDYKITNKVKYNMDIDFSLTHINSEPRLYMLQWTNLSHIDPFIKIPYQQLEELQSEIQGIDLEMDSYLDRFHNSFTTVRTNLSYEKSISIKYSYIVTLNDIYLDTENITDIGNYDTNDTIHDLYCNANDTFYQGNNPELINLSNFIVGNTSNPIVKAQKICTWISDNIEYGERNRTSIWSPDIPFGALETYYQRKGVCWEFAELMITLLRIQEIPARMAIGLTLDTLIPRKGDVFTYYSYWDNISIVAENPVNLHAWLEYYVPSLGWLPCDPTWSDSGTTYFNRLDCIHLKLTVGSWFALPHSPYYNGYRNTLHPLEDNNFMYNYNSSFEVTMTVLSSSYSVIIGKYIPYMTFLLISLIIIIFSEKISKEVKKMKINKGDGYERMQN